MKNVKQDVYYIDLDPEQKEHVLHKVKPLVTEIK